MINKLLYQKYHSTIKPQKRIISESNFTYRNIIKSIEKYLSKNIVVLDVGSATGTLSLYFASKGLIVDGIELSKNAYRYANINKNNLRFKNVSFINISIENYKTSKKYDLVTCFEVLEHIDNDNEVLNKINKVMKHQSILAISVPSKNAPLYRLGFLNNFDRKVGHLRRYSFVEIKQKIKKAGFVVIEEFKTEGILRNMLFTNCSFGWIVRFTKFNIINNLITFFDNFSLELLGESQIILICKKI